MENPFVESATTVGALSRSNKKKSKSHGMIGMGTSLRYFVLSASPISILLRKNFYLGNNMEGYLGETDVNVAKHPKYKDYTPKDWAMMYIEMYGQIDGDHHSKWVLDQVARILHGTPVLMKIASWKNGHTEERFNTGEPSKSYLDWVERMTEENGYDDGIAP